jgi:hypothetical protein
MTRSTDNLTNGVDELAMDYAFARWANEGGAPVRRSGSISEDRPVPLVLWFVPLILVPAFLIALMTVTVMHQKSW